MTRLFYVFCIGAACIYSTYSETFTAIPQALLNCYRSNFSEQFPKPPLTTKLLIELIRKLELDKSHLNLRTLTNSILHTVKLDGVVQTAAVHNEDIIPYRALGKQFYKHQFVVDHLTPGDTLLFPKDALNDTDLCILHFIISNTIDLRVRGDEKYTCHMLKSMPLWDKSEPKICPEEKGVVKSKWGTISAGHLIAGIASALQKDSVSLGQLVDGIGKKNNLTHSSRSRQINNVWVSTIVGDLAEVLINQGLTNPKLGSTGYWNDTLLPRVHYLTDNYWDMSEAELLGGLDALILASYIKEMESLFHTIRLSQILDMYYSNRGIAFNNTYKACERRNLYKNLLNNINLEQEVGSAAKVLQTLGSYGGYMEEDVIDSITHGVVQTYKEIAESLSYDACKQEGVDVASMEIIVILDETWRRYEVEKFLAVLSELLDISYFGSQIGLINGQNGAWLTNITSDLVQLYSDLSAKNVWPTTLSLTQSLHSVISYYQNKSVCVDFQKPYGKVVLILGQSAYLTDDDRATGLQSIQSIQNTFPETKIVFVTTSENTRGFDDISHYTDVLNVTNGFNVEGIGWEISKFLNNHPSSIMNFYCEAKKSHFEAYISPGLETYFEIHREYVSRTNISVKFKGNGYGDISICAYDAKSMAAKTCKGITVNSEVTFNIKDQCSTGATCSVQFAISANNSAFKCSEDDCRYPDQLRMDIFTSWTSSTVRQIPTHYLLVASICYFLAR